MARRGVIWLWVMSQSVKRGYFRNLSAVLGGLLMGSGTAVPWSATARRAGWVPSGAYWLSPAGRGGRRQLTACGVPAQGAGSWSGLAAWRKVLPI
jgi:hypothetical protein